MDRLIFSFEVALIGMGIVAVALFVLTLVTRLMSRLVYGNNPSEKNKLTVKEKKEKVNVLTDEKISPELIAVITAAVSMQSRGVFKVNTIKRIESNINGSWTKTAVQEQVQSFSQR